MATKLKNLRVKKVDVVDAGANPRADILLFKRRDEGAASPEPDTPDAGSGQGEGLFKRFLKWLRSEGVTDEEIRKEATSFDDQINAISLERIRDEIWSVCYALQSSLNSILCDEDMDSAEKGVAMGESAEQFHEAMKGYIANWSTGGTANIMKYLDAPDASDLLMAKTVHKNLGELIEKANMKGDLEEMIKIDKSKMTPEERAAYDAMIEKYAVEVEETVEKKTGTTAAGDDPDEDEVGEESCGGSKPTKKSAGATAEPEGSDDIYKGMHPAVAAELEALRKFREASEDRELAEVAKKYTVIGKKPEELVPTLKSLRAAGGSAYDDMIGVLDAAVAAVNASGTFSEIGKSGYSGGTTVSVGKSAAEGKIDAIAKGYMEKDPAMDYDAAIAKAWENNPGLIAEYEDEAGF